MASAPCAAVLKLGYGHDLVFQQPILNIAHTVAPHVHHKNLPYDVCRLRVGQEVVPVARVYDVPIGHSAVDALPALGLGLFDGPDFLGRIAGVKLVKPVSQRGKFVVLPRRVHAVVNGDITNIIFWKNDLNQFPGL